MKKIKSLIILFLLLFISVLFIYLIFKKKQYLYIILLLVNIILINYFYLTRNGSIRLCFILNGITKYKYENIDYENNNSYLNPYELDNKIYYLECKNYGVIKIANKYQYKSFIFNEVFILIKIISNDIITNYKQRIKNGNI